MVRVRVRVRFRVRVRVRFRVNPQLACGEHTGTLAAPAAPLRST